MIKKEKSPALQVPLGEGLQIPAAVAADGRARRADRPAPGLVRPQVSALDPEGAPRGEPRLGFWVGADASPGAYIIDFDAGRDPPGYRGIPALAVASARPAAPSAQPARRTRGRMDATRWGFARTT